MKPKAHIVTCTPTYTGQVESDFANALAVASMHCALRGILLDPRFAPGFSLVEYARNWLIAEALSIKAMTHVLWVDSDLFFQPDAIWRLYQRDLNVVCGVYTTKSDEPGKCIYPYTALGAEGAYAPGLQEAERVPGGFMLMTRAAIERVCQDCDWMEIEHQGEKRNSPRFFDLLMKDGKLYGEDYIACARLRAAGFPIYVETDINFKHWGRKAWASNLSATLAKEAAEGFEGQGTAAAWTKNDREQIKLG